MGPAAAQETKVQAPDFEWDLPHDRAARYDQFDARTGKPKGEFWLLGCELDGRVRAIDTSQFTYRFIFRRFPAGLKPGGTSAPKQLSSLSDRSNL